MSSIKRHALCIAFLLLLPAFLVPETLFQGKQLAQSDILQWRAGAESLMEHEEATGEQALWSTNMFGGMPAYVITNIKGNLSLDTLVNRYGRVIFPYVYYAFLLIGAYVFFLSVGASPLAATFGAVVVGFSTYIPIIIGAGHNTKFYAYVWTPWMLTGFRWLLQGRLLSGFAMFTFFLGLQVRSGHPQVTYYFLFILAAWWITELVVAAREGKLKPILTQTGLMVAAALIVVISVIPQFYALAEYSPYSIRGGSALATEGASGLDQEYAFVWSQGWGELMTLMVPNLYGGGELYWGPKPVTSGPHYFGALTALLLALSLFGKKDRLDKIFFGAGLLGVLFSLGNHFALLNDAMFAWFPGFNKFRTPEMWLMMSVVAFSVPAVRALDRSFTTKSIALAAGTVFTIGFLLLIGFGTWTGFEKEGERARYMEQVAQSNNVPVNDPRVAQAVNGFLVKAKADREDAATSDVLRFLVILGLGSTLLWLVSRKKLQTEHAMMGLVLITAFDMVSVGKRYIPEYAFQDKIGDVGAVIEAGRRPIDTWLEQNVTTAEGWSYRVLPLADNAFNNAVPAYFYPSLGGYTGAKLSVLQDVVDGALFSGTTGVNVAVMSMLNVRYVTLGYPGQIPGFTQVAGFDGQGFVFENEAVLPKAWFVDSVMTVSTPQAAFDALNSGLGDARRIAVVETSSPIVASPAGGTVTVQEYSAHTIRLQTESTEAGFLVLSEIYYPAGWSATLDGAEIPIHKTNYLLRGLEIPAGSHTVELTFEPSWLSGAKTAAMGAHLVILILVFGAGIMEFRNGRAA
jgi:hypothetical protein